MELTEFLPYLIGTQSKAKDVRIEPYKIRLLPTVPIPLTGNFNKLIHLDVFLDYLCKLKTNWK